MSRAWARGSTARWRAFRVLVLHRDGWACQLRLEGCTGVATCVDHIRPLSAGGHVLDPLNARAACRSCNSRRGAIPDHELPRRADPSRSW